MSRPIRRLSTGQKRGRRRALVERDGDRCHYCGSGFTEVNSPTIDHLVPRSRGGNNRLANLVLACRPCNHAKGGTLPASASPEQGRTIVCRA